MDLISPGFDVYKDVAEEDFPSPGGAPPVQLCFLTLAVVPPFSQEAGLTLLCPAAAAGGALIASGSSGFRESEAGFYCCASHAQDGWECCRNSNPKRWEGSQIKQK